MKSLTEAIVSAIEKDCEVQLSPYYSGDDVEGIAVVVRHKSIVDEATVTLAAIDESSGQILADEIDAMVRKLTAYEKKDETTSD